jgi:hypothetical protein
LWIQEVTKFNAANLQMDVCKVTKFNLAIFVVDVHKVAKFIIPGLITMSAFDWSMTGWHKTHATGL